MASTIENLFIFFFIFFYLIPETLILTQCDIFYFTIAPLFIYHNCDNIS